MKSAKCAKVTYYGKAKDHLKVKMCAHLVILVVS